MTENINELDTETNNSVSQNCLEKPQKKGYLKKSHG